MPIAERIQARLSAELDGTPPESNHVFVVAVHDAAAAAWVQFRPSVDGTIISIKVVAEGSARNVANAEAWHLTTLLRNHFPKLEELGVSTDGAVQYRLPTQT